MSKIDISTVAETLAKHREAISPALLREIVEELTAQTEGDEDEVAPPRAKQQYVIVGNATGEFGWICQIGETESPHSILDRVNLSAHDFNASKKGRLLPVRSVGEAFESVARKWFKNQGVAVKTKIMVPIIKTDNKLTEAPSV